MARKRTTTKLRETNPLQRTLLALATATALIAVLYIVVSLVISIFGASFLYAEYDPEVAESLATVDEAFNEESIPVLRSYFLRASGYLFVVGVALMVSGSYGIYCSRRNGLLLRLNRVVTVGLVVTVAGILWLPWNSIAVAWIIPFLLALGLQGALQYLSYRLRREATGETAEELAYEAAYKNLPREERLADDSRLGFLRVIQVAYLLNIIIMILDMVFSTRNNITYDFTTLFDWANLVFVGVSYYMIVKRLRITRTWMIWGSLAKIALNVIHYFVVQGVSATNAFVVALLSLWDIVVLIYFIRSDRVRLIMVNELSFEQEEEKEFTINRRSPIFWRNMLLYYCIFSTLGHWMEAGFCYLVSLGLFKGDVDFNNTMLFRDWLYPFPMHGIAVVLIALILYPLKEWLRGRLNPILTVVASFFVNMLFCSGIELAGGLMFNRNLQLWNYTDIPFNFMGQVCLQNAVGFGLAATLIVYFVYPSVERLVARVPKDVMNTVCVGVFTFYAILTALYVIDLSPEAAAANAKMIRLSMPKPQMLPHIR